MDSTRDEQEFFVFLFCGTDVRSSALGVAHVSGFGTVPRVTVQSLDLTLRS